MVRAYAIPARPSWGTIMLCRQYHWKPAMTKDFLLWMAGSLGLGLYSYLAMPLVVVSGYAVLAQQQFPDWTLRDIASLGGFGVFATFMSWLHVRTIDKHEKAIDSAMKVILQMVNKGYDLPPSDR